jgi:hypothetical protein
MKSKKSFQDLQPDSSPGIVGEFWLFLKHNKKFWMAPIIVLLLLFGLLIILGGSSAAPFIYSFF